MQELIGLHESWRKDDNDLIKQGRITMKPTTEQLALMKACKVGIEPWAYRGGPGSWSWPTAEDLLIEDGIMKASARGNVSLASFLVNFMWENPNVLIKRIYR